MLGPVVLVLLVVAGAVVAVVLATTVSVVRQRQLAQRAHEAELRQLSALEEEVPALREAFEVRARLLALPRRRERDDAVRVLDKGLRELGVQVELTRRLDDTIARLGAGEETAPAKEKLRAHKEEAQRRQRRLAGGIRGLHLSVTELLSDVRQDDEQAVRQRYEAALGDLERLVALHEDVARFVDAARRA